MGILGHFERMSLYVLIQYIVWKLVYPRKWFWLTPLKSTVLLFVRINKSCKSSRQSNCLQIQVKTKLTEEKKICLEKNTVFQVVFDNFLQTNLPFPCSVCIFPLSPEHSYSVGFPCPSSPSRQRLRFCCASCFHISSWRETECLTPREKC